MCYPKIYPTSRTISKLKAESPLMFGEDGCTVTLIGAVTKMWPWRNGKWWSGVLDQLLLQGKRAQSAILFTCSWRENIWIHAFPKRISTKKIQPQPEIELGLLSWFPLRRAVCIPKKQDTHYLPNKDYSIQLKISLFIKSIVSYNTLERLGEFVLIVMKVWNL